MTILDALRRFVTQLRADGRSHHTIGQYERHITALAKWTAGTGQGLGVENLDHETVALFLASPEARDRGDGTPKKATSINTLRSSIRVFGSYLHRAGFLAQDPARMVRRAICSSGPPRTLSQEDQHRLLATLAS
ncbi:MAG: site-specific integrase, partial [Candidatus Methylomirabilales bacterium]